MVDRLYRPTLSIVLLTTLSACGPSEPEVEPSLSWIQDNVLTPKCALPSCHSASFRAGGLILEVGMTYDSLSEPVTNQAAAAEGLAMIEPGAPGASFLFVKLQVDLDPSYGVLMPQGSNTGLDAEELDVIREWIEAGAPDD